jgi:Ferritin-like domain
LRAEQRDSITAGALGEQELQKQRRAQVADVIDRLREPAVDGSAAVARNAQKRSRRSARAGLDARALGQPVRQQEVDGAIDERAANRPHPADLPVGRQRAHQSPAVNVSLAEQGQNRPAAEREFRELLFAGHRTDATAPAVRMPAATRGAILTVTALRQDLTKDCILAEMSGRFTRSALLGTGARSSAALLLGGSAVGVLAATAEADPPAGPLGAISASDLAYVRLLIAVELLMANFYTEAIASKHLQQKALADARLALINEGEHYTYLAAVLTSTGLVALTAADVNFNYPQASFYTAASVTGLAVTLELVALGSYLGAAGNIANPVLQSAVAQITANEAQHFSAFALHSGQRAFEQGFPQVLTIQEASDALDAYTS